MQSTIFLRGALFAMLAALTACNGSSSDSAGPPSSAASTDGTAATAVPTASIALSSSVYSVPSSSTTAAVTIKRSGAAGSATVNYTTVNGSATAGTDYTATTGSVSWKDDDTAPKTVYVPVSRQASGKQFAMVLTSIEGEADFGSPTTATVAVAAAAATPTGSSTSSSGGSSTSSSSSGASGSSSSSGSSTSSGSSSSGSSSSSGAKTTTTSSKATLLTYLSGLATNNSKHILTGQHSNYWSSNQMDNVSAVYNQTGKYPAILGTDFNLGGSQENGVALSNQWLSAGGIVLLSWWPGNPNTGANSTDENNLAINFGDLLTPGTKAYTNWYASLDSLAASLKQINGPVLFRPFVELNGSWFWWGKRDPGQFIQVWQQMHDYLVNTKGVTNLLWVYNVNAGVGNYTSYYPGPSYVDIVAMDSYPASAGDAAMYNQLVGLGKPIIYAEAGVISATQPGQMAGNNDQLLQAVEANFPEVVALVIWCQNWSLNTQQGAATFMNDGKVITRTDLPANL